MKTKLERHRLNSLAIYVQYVELTPPQLGIERLGNYRLLFIEPSD